MTVNQVLGKAGLGVGVRCQSMKIKCLNKPWQTQASKSDILKPSSEIEGKATDFIFEKQGEKHSWVYTNLEIGSFTKQEDVLATLKKSFKGNQSFKENPATKE